MAMPFQVLGTPDSGCCDPWAWVMINTDLAKCDGDAEKALLPAGTVHFCGALGFLVFTLA